MSLAEELKTLERQRAAEIRTLHQTYLRTKRTVIRAASPERIMRKHLGLSLAAAALLGIAIAPRPGPAAVPVSKEPEEKGRGSSWGFGALLARFKPAIHQVAPEVAAFIPNQPEQQGAGPAASAEKPHWWHRLLRTVLVEGGALLLSKIDFMALLEQFLHRDTPGNSAASEREATGTVASHTKGDEGGE
jgi:hypothetical protein